MGRTRIYDYADLAGQLVDFLPVVDDTPDEAQTIAELGVSLPKQVLPDKRDIAIKLRVPSHVAERVIREARLILASDGINIPLRHEGRRVVYYLTGRPEHGQQWQAARIAKKMSELEIDLAWWNSMVKATDGRSLEGKKARLALRWQQRLFEDLQETVGSND